MNNEPSAPFGWDTPIRNDEAAIQSMVASAISSAYVWMTLALGLTGLVAYEVSTHTEWFLALIGWPMLVLFVVELALVWIVGACIHKLSFGAAAFLLALYSAINGVTLFPIFVAYTQESIVTTFLITGATFGTMALIGHSTRANLSSIGGFLFMGLIGLIIASVVNIFMHSSTLQWIISIAGVLIFVGLTAYDAQKIRVQVEAAASSGQVDLRKISLIGSLELYLDFINLFLYLLRLTGRRR